MRSTPPHPILRKKSFAALLVGTLGLGIAGNTALCGVIEGVLLHPLAYPHEERVRLATLIPGGPARAIAVLPEFHDRDAWAMHARSLDDIEAFGFARKIVTGTGLASRVMTVGLLSPGMAQMAGQRPLLGRELVAADTAAAATRVAVLSASFWEVAFGGRREVIGTTIDLDSAAYTVVGVLPRDFRLPNSSLIDAPAIWTPIGVTDRERPIQTVVLLKSGVAAADAAAELTRIRERDSAVRGTHYDGLAVRLVEAGSPGTSSRAVLLMWAASGLLLLVAWVGAAHLVLFREWERRRTNAIRTALGAPWLTLARASLTENATLIGVAALGGSLAGWASLRLVIRLRPPRLAALDAARVDWRVAAVSVFIALVLVLTVSGLSLWRGGRAHDIQVLLRDLPSSPSLAMRRVRAWLVITEMGMSAVVLVGATALMQTLNQLETVDPGFSPVGVIGVRINTGVASQLPEAERQRLTAELVARARSIGRVVGVARGDNLPPSLGYVHGTIEPEGGVPIRPGPASVTQINRVSAEYFAVLGLRMTDGTTFHDTDMQSSDIVINEACASLLWPGASAVGRRLRLGPTDAWKRVVGVVADAALAGPYVDPHQPAIFAPLANRAYGWVVLRLSDEGHRGAASVLSSLRDPAGRPLEAIQLSDVIESEVAPVRFAAAIADCFAALTVLLSAFGLYGVLAYSVTLRRKELAIRMALGATARRIAMDTVAYGMTLVGCGAVGGAVVGQSGARVLAALVPLASSPGWATYGAALGALFVVGLTACVGPTWAAVKTAPGIMLAE